MFRLTCVAFACAREMCLFKANDTGTIIEGRPLLTPFSLSDMSGLGRIDVVARVGNPLLDAGSLRDARPVPERQRPFARRRTVLLHFLQ